MEHRPSPEGKPARPGSIRRVNGHVRASLPGEQPKQAPPPRFAPAAERELEAEGQPTRLWPRYASILFGIWLFASAFLWPHSEPSRANSWFVGVLIAAAGFWGLRDPAGRLLNTLIALWLLMSTLLIYPRTALTFWNNLLVAGVVFGLSLIPSRGVVRSGP